MRRLWIPFVLVLLGGCEKSPEQLPPARLAPESLGTQASPAAPAAEEAESDGKGVGAAGCGTAECEAACEGFEQPECAEAYAEGCFGESPPANKNCEKFGKADGDPAPRSKKSKSASGDSIDAKATPIGD